MARLREFTHYLTGPLFAEFAAQRGQDLHVPKSEDITMQADDRNSTTTTPAYTVEDHLTEGNCTNSIQSPPSDVLQEPNCDQQTAVDLKLIGGEQTLDFDLSFKSTTRSHFLSGTFVVCNPKSK